MVSDDAIKSIEAMIAEIDKKLSEQINIIMHHEDFKALEGSWRGLHHLVNNTETDETLKIQVFNISKKDVGKTIKKYKGTAWDQSPLFKKLYEEEFGMPGGEPFGAIVGDYYFDHSPAGRGNSVTEWRRSLRRRTAPFICGGFAELMNMDSWQELGDPARLDQDFPDPRLRPMAVVARIGRCPLYRSDACLASCRAFLTAPKPSRWRNFDFEEDTEGADHNNYVWSNAAYRHGDQHHSRFKIYGWCARIRGAESGGMVEGLPCHTFPTDDGGVDMKCPTEIAITDRREAELAKNGFMPLSHWKNTDYAVFIGAQVAAKAR